jgi:hypothetical protein
MTRLTLREASRLIIGRLPATTTGGYRTEAAQLQGIFQSSPPRRGETLKLLPKATLDLTPVLEAQIAALRAVSELLRAQLTDTREECDRWRQEAERLALPPPAPVPKPLRRRRWWQPAW